MDTGPVYYSLLAVYTAYVIVISGLFFSFRHLEPIKSRGYQLTLVTAFVTVFFFCYFASIQVQLDMGNALPCNVVIWFSVMFLPFWVTPYMLRGERVVKNYWDNMSKLQKTKQSLYLKYRVRYPTSKVHSLAYFCIVFFFVILSLIVEYADTDSIKGDLSVSECLGPQVYVVACQGIFYIVTVIFFLYYLARAKDAFSIRQELLALIIVCIPVYIIIGIIPIDPSSFPSTLKSNWLLMIIIFSSATISLVYPLIVAFMQRNYSKMSSKPLLVTRTSSNRLFIPESFKNDEFFNICLEEQGLLESFQNFTVESWCVENVLFYLGVLHYEKTEESLRSQLAEEICQGFVYPGAPLEINIDGSTRQKIIEEMRRKPPVPPLELFEEAKKVVFSQLRFDVFPKWLHTSSFKAAYEKSGKSFNEVQQETADVKRQRADTFKKEVDQTKRPSQVLSTSAGGLGKLEEEEAKAESIQMEGKEESQPLEKEKVVKEEKKEKEKETEESTQENEKGKGKEKLEVEDPDQNT